MGLKRLLFDAPIEERIALDREQNTLTINLRGYHASQPAHLDCIKARIESLCSELGHKVDMVAWYDGLRLDSGLDVLFTDMVADLEKRFYKSATRYTRDPFTRLRFGAELAKREVSMRVHGDSIVSGLSLTGST